MVVESVGPEGPQSMVDLIRSFLLSRSTGRLTIELGGAERVFFFLSGDLYLDQDHPLARASGAPKVREKAEEPWLDKVLDYFDTLGEVEHQFAEGTSGISTDLFGPIALAPLVMRHAVRGLDEFQLMRTLGGEEQDFISHRDSPLVGEVDLDPKEAFFLSRLEQPASVKELLRQSELEQGPGAERLCRLLSIGLIERYERPQIASKSSLLNTKLLGRFSKRIGEELEREPVKLDREAHRRKIANLMARLGGLNYYELLGISVGSTAEEIHAAYTRLGRLVHPSHVEALGFEGKEAGIELLFEKATEAYLTLSDQDRRGQYLQEVGAFSDGSLFGRSEESRREEVEELAKKNFQMAQHLVNRQDFYYAIELLNQAVRMEAKPEYYALLGQCQSQNPQWYDKAISSYGRAVQLAPDNADFRVALGEVYEKGNHLARARAEYQKALELLPGHSEATSGLVRSQRQPSESTEKSWWQKLLGR